MKLDPRIIEGEKPFDCVDAESETVKSFIGKKGYFANHISEFIDISDLKEDVLTGINPDDPDCEVYKATCATWEYFLPKEWVKEPEKKYRPFTLNEFLVKFPMLTNITMREKGDNDCIITCAVTAYRTRVMSADICLGVEWISLKELFDKYEYKNTLLGIWTPFGE